MKHSIAIAAIGIVSIFVTTVQGDCRNDTLTTCQKWGTLSKHDNGCLAYVQGWEAGPQNCHYCSAVAKDYKSCDLEECEAMCEELYSEHLDNKPYCTAGCEKAKELLETTACACDTSLNTQVRSCPGGNFYKVLPGVDLTQPQAIAQAYASSYSGVQGHLVALESKAEADCLTQLIAPGLPFWFGANNEDDKSVWEWETGPSEGSVFWTSSTGTQDGFYSNWGVGQPQVAGNENCAGTNELGMWHDWPCTTRNHFYTVVEYETSSALEGYVLVGNGACRTTGADHFQVVKGGQRCKDTSTDLDLGYADSEGTCAAMCSARNGCGHVFYGYNQNRGQCFQTAETCLSTWEAADFDFISLDTHSQMSQGTYFVINNVNLVQCAKNCTGTETCVAIEFNAKLNRCEVHSEPVTRVLNTGGGTLVCYDKLQVATDWMLVGEEICIDPDSTDDAEFTIPSSVLAHEFKLVHTRGEVSCLDWQRCSPDQATCACIGQVRYGVEGRWAYINSTSSVACNTNTFGDPAVGETKLCECAPDDASQHAAVTCNFTIDNTVKSVYYNGKDITTNVFGNLGAWTADKSISFVETPGASFVIQGSEASDCHGCTCSGFQMICEASTPTSPWHKLTTTSAGWRAKESESGLFTPADIAGVGQGNTWDTPCQSTSGFHMQNNPALRKIWAPGGLKYALFAITPSDKLPQSDGIVANPSEAARAYSSVWENRSYGIDCAQSELDANSAWCAGVNTIGQWMQIDLGFAVEVSGVVVQARGNINTQNVITFSLSYSIDNNTFTPIRGVFDGSPTNEKVRSVFEGTYTARYVRFTVLTWSAHISMRAGVLVDRPLGSCLDGKACCPPGYKADALNVDGAGKTWSHTASITECAISCNTRVGCTEFEYNPELPNNNCGTYTSGTVMFGQVGQWLTCVKADKLKVLGPICQKMRSRSEDTCSDGDGGSEFCDAYVTSQDSCLQHCESRGLTCSGAWQGGNDGGTCSRTTQVECAAVWTSKVCRCTPQIPTFVYDPTPRTYLASKQHCESLGYNLASIHSDIENTLVTGLVSSTAYLGATNIDSQWTWADGTSWNYVNPVNDGLKGVAETTLAMDKDGKWHDWLRGAALLGVVCRKNPGFVLGDVGVDSCPAGATPIRDINTCELAAASLDTNYNASFNGDVGTQASVCVYCQGCHPIHTRVSSVHGILARWLCELEEGRHLLLDKNLLLGQPATVSSNYSKSLYLPVFITDGKFPSDFNYAADGFWHSQGGTEKATNWAEVPLEYPIVVTRVKVWNRYDCCSGRINGAMVYLIDAKGGKHACGAKLVSNGPTLPIQVNCSFAEPAVSVRIELDNGVWLQIAELEAFGKATEIESDPPITPHGFWGCAKQDTVSPLSVRITSSGGQSIVPARDDYNYRVAEDATGFGYFLQGFSPISAELVFEAPNNQIPLFPGTYRVMMDRTLKATGRVCADVYVNAMRDDDDWDVLAVEVVGGGNGVAFDSDPLRVLNFPEFENSPLSGGDYHVRMSWGDDGEDFMQFHVPAGSNIISQARENKDIEVDQVLTTVTSVEYESQASFCHACVVGGAAYGDTCWGVLPLTDTHRQCGCNSGGWNGEGMYYGGYQEATVCGGHSGGFSGPKTDTLAKGGLGSVGLTLSVRTECASYEYYDVTRTHDFCQPIRTCTPVEYEVTRPTWESDRKCGVCLTAANCFRGLFGNWSFVTDATKTLDGVSATNGVWLDDGSSVHAEPDIVSGKDSGLDVGNALKIQDGVVPLDTKRWLPAGAKTITFWVSSKSFSLPHTFINQTGTNAFYVGIENSRVYLGAGKTHLPATLSLIDTRPDSYHPFAIVDDGEGLLSVYQDGQLLGSMDYEGDTETMSGGSFLIGGVGTFNIGNVVVYSKMLTEFDIKLMAGVSASYNHPSDSQEWEMVFRHDSSNGVFWDKGVLSYNADSTDIEAETRFARLNELEKFRSHENAFTFKMVWPNICNENDCTGDENNFVIWRQSSNPAQAGVVTGYEELSLGFWASRNVDVSFGGLEYNDKQCLMDGNANSANWWYAVGSYIKYRTDTTFPGPKRDDPLLLTYVSQVELYAFNYSFETGVSDSDEKCPSSGYSKLGRACCRAADGSNSAGPTKVSAANTPADCRQQCDHEGIDCRGFEFRPAMGNRECELHFGPIDHVELNGGGIECSCYVRTTDTGPARVFFNETSQRCQDFSSCEQGLEYEAAPPTSSSDRVCTRCVTSCAESIGTYIDGECTSTTSPVCQACEPGFFCDGDGRTPCQENFYSLAKSTSCTPCIGEVCKLAINAGVYLNTTDNTVATCPCGFYCPKGSQEKLLCAENTVASRTSMQRCTACDTGQSTVGQRRDTCIWNSNGSAVSPYTSICESVSGETFPPIAAPTHRVFTPPPSTQTCTVTFDIAADVAYSALQLKGSWDWSTPFTLTHKPSGKWQGSAEVAAGRSYEWGVTFGAKQMWLLDETQSACGTTFTQDQPGGDCSFDVSASCATTGDTSIVAREPIRSPTASPTDILIELTYPVALIVVANYSVNPHTTITVSGPVDWSVRDTQPSRSYPVWTETHRFPPGEYRWGVTSATHVWLLGTEGTYCGESINNHTAPAVECVFVVSKAGKITGDVKMHLGVISETTTTQSSITATPNTDGLSKDGDKGSASNLVDIIIGVVVSLLLVIGVIVWYFKRKMGKARVVLSRDATGAVVGTIAFDNPSYNDVPLNNIRADDSMYEGVNGSTNNNNDDDDDDDDDNNKTSGYVDIAPNTSTNSDAETSAYMDVAPSTTNNNGSLYMEVSPRDDNYDDDDDAILA